MKLIILFGSIFVCLNFSKAAPKVPPCVHIAKECMKKNMCFGPLLLLDKLFEPEKSVEKRSGK